jgi:hypothetical protein
MDPTLAVGPRRLARNEGQLLVIRGQNLLPRNEMIDKSLPATLHVLIPAWPQLLTIDERFNI